MPLATRASRLRGALLAASLLAPLAACHDILGGGDDPPSSLIEVALAQDAPGDIPGLGTIVISRLRDSVAFYELRIYVDSGTTDALVAHRVQALAPYGHDNVDAVVVPSDGEHRITIAITADGDRIASASISRRFVLGDAPYTARALPDSGFGAGVVGIDARGDVAGWIRGANGRRRPAVWRDGALTVIPAGDSAEVIATRVNAAGDVLLQWYATGPVSYPRSAAVLRSDGALLPISGANCCTFASDLSDDRRAIASGHNSFQNSVVLDIASNIPLETRGGTWTTLNAAGMSAGHIPIGESYVTEKLVTQGFPTPPRPTPVLRVCDVPGRFSRYIPVDVDAAGNLIADYCGNPVLAPNGGAVVPLFLRTGAAKRARLSRSGGLVAAFDSAAAAVYLTTVAGEKTRQVRLTPDAWRLDALGDVNGTGMIAAHGVEKTTGRSAALLLTPEL